MYCTPSTKYYKPKRTETSSLINSATNTYQFTIISLYGTTHSMQHTSMTLQWRILWVTHSCPGAGIKFFTLPKQVWMPLHEGLHNCLIILFNVLKVCLHMWWQGCPREKSLSLRLTPHHWGLQALPVGHQMEVGPPATTAILHTYRPAGKSQLHEKCTWCIQC